MGNQKNKQIAQKVVDRIIETINEGKSLPWVKPWGNKSHTVRVLNGQKEITIYPSAWRRNGKEYRGANTYLPVGEYITWGEAKKENKDAHLKKGSKSWPVVYWNFIEKEEQDPDDPDKTVKVTIPILKYYLVYTGTTPISKSAVTPTGNPTTPCPYGPGPSASTARTTTPSRAPGSLSAGSPTGPTKSAPTNLYRLTLTARRGREEMIMKLYIGYEYKSAYGRTIRKLVACDGEEEYRKMKALIEDAGYDVIEFWSVSNARNIIEKR